MKTKSLKTPQTPHVYVVEKKIGITNAVIPKGIISTCGGMQPHSES